MIAFKYIKFLILFTIILSIPYMELKSKSPLSIYEIGYRLEKDYPLYSIPLYEQVLNSNPDYKLKRITATRLYYLYKKFRKYPELLTHYSKYRSLLSLGKEHSDTVNNITKAYRISGHDFYTVYPMLANIDSEKIGILLDYIMETNSNHLFHFSYFYLIAHEKFEELRTLMFYLPESIAKPSLKIGLLVKMKSPNTVEVIENFLNRDELTESMKSDSFYLLGQHYLGEGNYTRAEEFFNLSQRYGKPERSKRELAKISVAQGSIQNACKLMTHKPRSFHEADHLLYLACMNRANPPKDLKYSLEILGRKENQDYYNSMIHWFWK